MWHPACHAADCDLVACSIDLAAAAQDGDSPSAQLRKDLNLLMEELTVPASAYMLPMIVFPEAGTRTSCWQECAFGTSHELKLNSIGSWRAGPLMAPFIRSS